MLATVKQQEVHLVVNPSKGQLRGWTIITAAAPQAGQDTIGLHSLGHTISSITINGLPATFTLSPGPEPGLAEVTSSTTVKDVAEQAYFDYLSMAHRELLPDLVIQLPEGWFELAPVAPVPAAPPAGADKEKASGKKAGKKGDKAAAAEPAQEPVTAPAPAPDGAAAPLSAAAAAAPAADGAAALTEDTKPATPAAPATNTAPGAAASTAPANGSAPAPAAAEERLIIIRVAFSKPLNSTDSSAVLLVPGSDLCDSCEWPAADVAAARYLVTDPQLRRTRALFPCAEVEGVVATYELHVTVPVDHVAVCDGLLKSQVVSYLTTPDGYRLPHSRTFVFVSEVPVKASQVLLATGPLVALPLTTAHAGRAGAAAGGGKSSQKGAHANTQLQEIHTCSITCFGPPDRMEHVAYTVRPLQLIIKCFEKHLSHRFPYSQLHVVFLPAAAFRAKSPPVSVGTNIILMSTSMLVTPDACEATVTTTLLLADCLARCVFGGLLMPLGPEDAWIHEGLAVYLSEVWTTQWLGKNETAWRRHKERMALAVSDNGSMPPLCTRTTERAGLQITPGQVCAVPLSSAQAYGNPFGTELLEPEHLRRWKAACVIRMCVQRAGEDQIRRILGGLVAKAGANTANPKFRFVATDKFLKWLSKQAGIKGNEAFAQRWIYGRGCPEFELGVVYRKNNTVDLALRQAGGAASRRAALLASRAAKETGVEDDLQTHVKVSIHEAENVGELHLKLTPNDTILAATHELQTKVASKRPGGRKTKGQQEAIQQAKEEGDEEGGGSTGPKFPLLYVRLDPSGDWICRPRVYQPEGSWVAQLDKSRDVVAQSIAVAGLASLAATMNQGAAAALAACLRSTETYCRVRAEAALALGLTVGADPAQAVLCGYLHDALYDPTTLSLKPNSFGDMSEYVVLCAVAVAVGMLRGDNDKSPPEAMDMILNVLDNCDNTGNLYSDAGYVACFIEATGHMQPSTPAQLARLLEAIDRQLALEDLSPSPHFVVGAACLSALQRLANQLTDNSAETRAGVRQTLQSYASLGVPLPLRHAAARHLMAHAVCCSSVDKGSALLTCLLELHQQPGWGAAGRTALIMDAFNIMGRLLSERAIKPGEDQDMVEEIEEETAVRVEDLAQLYRLLHTRVDARERHAVFMLLQRMAKQDPTLFREREEELVDPMAVSQPEATVRSGGAAPTGPATTRNAPAVSGGTTGTVALTTGGTAAAAVAAVGGVRKFKVKVGALAGAGGGGAAPAASGGTVGTVPSGGQGGAASQPGGPSSPTHTTSVMGPSSTFLSPISHSKNVLQPIPEGGEVHKTTSLSTAIAKPGGVTQPEDEVVQPIKAGVGLPRTSSAGGGLSALGSTPSSPPRDPRTRAGPAASSGAPTTTAARPTTSSGTVAQLAAQSPAPVRSATPPPAPAQASQVPSAEPVVTSPPESAVQVKPSTPPSVKPPAAPSPGSAAGKAAPPAGQPPAAPSPGKAAPTAKTTSAPAGQPPAALKPPLVPPVQVAAAGGGSSVKPSPTPSPRAGPAGSPLVSTPPEASTGGEASQGGSAADGTAAGGAAKPSRVPFGAGRRRSSAGGGPSSTSPVDAQPPAAAAQPVQGSTAPAVPAAVPAAAAAVTSAGPAAAMATTVPAAAGAAAGTGTGGPPMRRSGPGDSSGGGGAPAAGLAPTAAGTGPTQPPVTSPGAAAHIERKRSFDFPPLRPDAPRVAAAVAAAAIQSTQPPQATGAPPAVPPTGNINKFKVKTGGVKRTGTDAGPPPAQPSAAPASTPAPAAAAPPAPGPAPAAGSALVPAAAPGLPPAPRAPAGGTKLKLKLSTKRLAPPGAVPAAGPPLPAPPALPVLPAQPSLPTRVSDGGGGAAPGAPAAPTGAPKIKFKLKGLGGGGGAGAGAPPAAAPPGSEGSSQPRKKPRTE